MKNTIKHFKIYLKKKIGQLGLNYCPNCGSDLWFDEDKWNMGYNVRSRCLHCDYLDRFDLTVYERQTIRTPQPKDH